MLTFTGSHADSMDDLEAFRFVGPWSGKFKSLIAVKEERGVSAETRIEFERVALILMNLNIGYTGTGPSCLTQILVELGADEDAARRAVASHSKQLHVERVDTAGESQEGEEWIRLGDHLALVEKTPPDVLPE